MNHSKILKVALGVIALALIVFFYVTNQTRVYSWQPNYKLDSKEPYGSYLLFELFSKQSDQFHQVKGPVYKVLEDEDIENANYIFIGKEAYYSEVDIQALVSFVERGNKVWILSNESPSQIINETDLVLPLFHTSYRDSTVNMQLNPSDAAIKLTYKVDFKPEFYDWYYVDSIASHQDIRQGFMNNEYVNFLDLKVGEGHFYFHFSPIVFTNYFLREDRNFEYASSVFSDMNSGTIYWDDFSAIPGNESSDAPSPLSYILSQESLRWAWYILIGGVIVYMILYTRRKQKPIAVPQKVTNSSLEFVKTIGGMYYQQEAHLKVIQEQKHSLLTFIRIHYGIPTNNYDDDFLKKVSLKSGIEAGQIDYIFREARRLERIVEVSTSDLIDFNKLTEHFYSNCK